MHWRSRASSASGPSTCLTHLRPTGAILPPSAIGCEGVHIAGEDEQKRRTDSWRACLIDASISSFPASVNSASAIRRDKDTHELFLPCPRWRMNCSPWHWKLDDGQAVVQGLVVQCSTVLYVPRGLLIKCKKKG